MRSPIAHSLSMVNGTAVTNSQSKDTHNVSHTCTHNHGSFSNKEWEMAVYKQQIVFVIKLD